jgi:hypothetical protein
MQARLHWFTGLRKPYARRASSLASRLRLSEAAFVIPVKIAQTIWFSHLAVCLGETEQLGDVIVLAHQS